MSNITNHLNKIKTAIYGKDVRESIHDAIKEVYDDASINHDNANMEVKLARGVHDTLNDRLVNFEHGLTKANAQVDNVISQLSTSKQRYITKTGCNIWYRSGSSESYRDEVLDDMVRLKMDTLVIPCHNTISGDDASGYTYTKDLSKDKISALIQAARNKGINDIVVKLHRLGAEATSSTLWMDMWETLVNEYVDICVENDVSSISIVNEQRYATKSNKDRWIIIVNHVKSKGIKVLCSLADFSEIESCVILDLVDVIGINHYPALVSYGERVSQEELTKRIYNFSVPKIKRLKLKYNKPIYITEIGATRNVECLSAPANWEFKTTEQSLMPQSQFVGSVFSIFACSGVVDAVFWWSSDDKNKINTFTFFGNELAETNYKKFIGGE